MSHVVIAVKDGQQQIYKVCLKPEQPIFVGRGWQNDVIINDEFIDAKHISFSVDTDGCVNVADLDTKNGTRQLKKAISGSKSYQLGDTLSVGESVISLHATDTVVAPALKQDAVQKASRVFSSFFWVAIATLLAGVTIAGMDYWSSGEETTKEKLVELSFQFGSVMLVWCLIAGFIGKIFRHKTHFKLHWIFMCATVVLGTILTVTTDVLRFNLDTDLANIALPQGLALIVMFVTGYGFLSLSTRMGLVKKCMIASTLAALPLIYTLSTSMLAEDHETWESYASVNRINQPPSFMLRAPVSIETHIQNTEALFAQLDAELEAIDKIELNLDEPPLERQIPVQITENLDE